MFLGLILGGWVVWAIVDAVRSAERKKQEQAAEAEMKRWGTNDATQIEFMRVVLEKVFAIPRERWTFSGPEPEAGGKEVLGTYVGTTANGARAVIKYELMRAMESEYFTPSNITLAVDGQRIGHFWQAGDYTSGAEEITRLSGHVNRLFEPERKAEKERAARQRQAKEESARRDMMNRL
jgi:hypothetical protein